MPVVCCRLSKQATPAFPDRCVECGAEQPGSIVRLIAKGPSHNPFAGWFTVVAPACPGCAPRLRRQALVRFGRTVVIGLGTLGISALCLYKLGLRDAALGGISFGATVVAIIGIVVWERKHPPAFKIDVGPGYVDYEFRDRGHGQEFAARNGLKLP